MGIYTDKIIDIINKGQPNNNLIQKSQEIYDIQAQLNKEQKFYTSVVDPYTNKTITNIKELNNLILKLDDDTELFNFGALLPNGAIERELSKKYNLALTEKNKFTQEQQEKVKQILQYLGDEAFKVLQEKKERLLLRDMEQQLLDAIVIGMGAINLKSKDFKIFMSKSSFKYSTKTLDYFNINEIPKTLNVINQAIPVYYQVKPIYNNAKTMLRMVNALKDDDKKGDVLEKTGNIKEKDTSTGPVFFL